MVYALKVNMSIHSCNSQGKRKHNGATGGHSRLEWRLPIGALGLFSINPRRADAVEPLIAKRAAQNSRAPAKLIGLYLSTKQDFGFLLVRLLERLVT